MSNLLFVTTWSEKNEFLLGGQHSLITLLDSLNREVFTPILVVRGSCAASKAAEALGIQIEIIPQRADLTSSLGTFGRLLDVRSYRRKLARLVKTSSIDAVWCHNEQAVLEAGPVARKFGIPLVWNIFKYASPETMGARKNHERCLRYADRIVVEYEAIRKDLFDSDDLRIETVYPPVKQPPSETAPSKPDIPIIGTIGKITPRKRQADFIEMAASLNRMGITARYEIVGGPETAEDREYEESLHCLAKDNDIAASVSFMGWREDIYDVMAKWSLFVMPSEFEGLPRVVLEAMHAGIPIAGTRVGGVPEALDDGNAGILFDAGDVTSLTEAAKLVLSDHELAGRLSTSAQDRARELFSANRYRDYYDRLFRELTKKIS